MTFHFQFFLVWKEVHLWWKQFCIKKTCGSLTDYVEQRRTCIYKKFNRIENNQNCKSRDLKGLHKRKSCSLAHVTKLTQCPRRATNTFLNLGTEKFILCLVRAPTEHRQERTAFRIVHCCNAVYENRISGKLPLDSHSFRLLSTGTQRKRFHFW